VEDPAGVATVGAEERVSVPEMAAALEAGTVSEVRDD
jgi:hypothetical protein